MDSGGLEWEWEGDPGLGRRHLGFSQYCKPESTTIAFVADVDWNDPGSKTACTRLFMNPSWRWQSTARP